MPLRAVLFAGLLVGCAQHHTVEPDAGLRLDGGPPPAPMETQSVYFRSPPDYIAPLRTQSFGRMIDLEGNMMAVTVPEGVFLYEGEGARWNFVGIIRDENRFGPPDHARFADAERLLLRNNVYRRAGNRWNRETVLNPVGPRPQRPESWDISGDIAVLGYPYESSSGVGIDPPINGTLINSGAAVVFRREAGGWFQDAFIKAPDTQESLLFGEEVAIDGDTMAISAAGARIYVYRRSAEGWVLETQVEGMGWGMALRGDVLVAPHTAPDGPVATVHERRDGRWRSQILPARPTTPRGVTRVAAVSDHMLAVGSLDYTGGTGLDSEIPPGEVLGGGSVYVYSREGERWVFRHVLKPDVHDEGDRFGEGVAISGNTVIAGAGGDDGIGFDYAGDPDSNHSNDTGALWFRDFPWLAP